MSENRNNFNYDYFLTGERKIIKFDSKTAHFGIMFQTMNIGKSRVYFQKFAESYPRILILCCQQWRTQTFLVEGMIGASLEATTSPGVRGSPCGVQGQSPLLGVWGVPPPPRSWRYLKNRILVLYRKNNTHECQCIFKNYMCNMPIFCLNSDSLANSYKRKVVPVY